MCMLGAVALEPGLHFPCGAVQQWKCTDPLLSPQHQRLTWPIFYTNFLEQGPLFLDLWNT